VTFLVVGDVGLDEYLDEPAPRPGGCALNVACALASEGARAALAGPIGPDGASLVEEAGRRGVDASLVTTSQGSTPRQRIHLRADGEREFRGYAAGVLRDWRPDAALTAAVRAASLVYVPAFDVTETLARDLLGQARTVAVDLMNLRDLTDGFIALACARATVVFAGLDAARDAMRIEALRDARALVVVTLGAAGARAFADGKTFAVDAAPVPGGRVVDTTGCGDAFAGAFLAARERGASIVDALEAGSKRGASTAAHRGALSPRA
jgi:sugar/nucleoside kinase (ribokinase family)